MDVYWFCPTAAAALSFASARSAPDRPPLAPRSALTPSRAQPGWPLPVLLAGGLVAGLLVGAVAGWGTARSAVPPTLAPAQSVDPTVALPQGGTATALALVVDTTAVAPADAAKTEPKTADAARPQKPTSSGRGPHHQRCWHPVRPNRLCCGNCLAVMALLSWSTCKRWA
jgi:hypothetical protein